MADLSPQQLDALLNGDEAALAAAIAHMMPQIRRGASMCTCPGLEFEDAVQEGIIGLFRAIKSFSPNRSASFETYASVCIQNAQLSAQRAAGRKKHGPLNTSVPLEDDLSASQPLDPEELAIQSEQSASWKRWLREHLSPFERDVLALFLQGSGHAQIAAALGRTPKAVENALGRVRRKLKTRQ